MERATLAQIAKEFSCSRAAVRLALTKAGIPLRHRFAAGGVGAGLPFGTMVIKGRRVPSQAENRVIEVIQALRQDRLSFDKIAERLTQLGIPTKTRRRKWNGGSVRRVYLAKHSDEE